MAEAHAHLERALALWEAVPDAAGLAGLDLAELCSWTAELASQTVRAPRAVELAQKAIDLVEKRDALRAAVSTTGSVATSTNAEGRRRPLSVRAHGRARAGGATVAGARAGSGLARGGFDARLAL